VINKYNTIKKRAITYEDAINSRNATSKHDLLKLLATVFAVSAGGRAAVGVLGNMRNNIAKRKQRAEISNPGDSDIVFDDADREVKSSSLFGSESRPQWFLPAAAVGTPLAGAGGWIMVSKIMKAYRKHKAKTDLESAKNEFEDALNNERGSKFACDLSELAEKYKSGELDCYLNKESTVVDKGLSVYWTLLAALAAAGTPIGWRLAGKSDKATDVKAYKEIVRRKQMNRPLSLTAKTKPALPTTSKNYETSSDQPEAEDDTMADDVKSAGLSKFIVPMLGGAAGAGIGGLGIAKWLGSRGGEDWTRQKILKQVGKLSRDPKFSRELYSRLLPAFQRTFAERNPMLSSLFNVVS